MSDKTVPVPLSFLKDLKEYIEDMEVAYWQGNSTLQEIIKDGDMPYFYGDILKWIEDNEV